MTPEAVVESLEATKIWSQPFQVHITGGEPFLNFPLLLHTVQVAQSLAIPCYVETNAGWCVNAEFVTKRFNELRKVGLGAILISCSPFHAEKIPPRYTLLAISKALEIFGSHKTIVYLPDWVDQVSRFRLDKPTSLEHYIDVYGRQATGRLFWEGYSLIPGGRSAYRLGHLAQKYPAESFLGTNCQAEILYAHHSHFDLYGNYISSFCGGLTNGDWHDLPQLIADYQAKCYPRIIRILVEKGPHGLYEFTQNEYGYSPQTEGYVGKCHLCVDVRRHLVQHNDFVELKPQ